MGEPSDELKNVMRLFHSLFSCCYDFSHSITQAYQLDSPEAAQVTPSLNAGPARGTIVRVLGKGGTGVVLYASRNTQRPPDTAEMQVHGSGELIVSNMTPTSPVDYKFYTVKFVNLKELHIRDVRRVGGEVFALGMCNFFSIIKAYFFLVRNNKPVEINEREINLDALQDSSGLVLEIEYLNNGDLFSEISNRRRNKAFFPQQNIVLIFVQILMAVYYLHERVGIIHRDIKPGNVLLSSNGTVKLCDLGFSKIMDVSKVNMKANATFCGTPAYMAPEMYRKQSYSKEVDMYGLGCILFEMILLEPPFHGDTPAVGDAVKEGPPAITENPSNPFYYDPELVTLAQRLMSQNMDERPSALDVLCMPGIRRTIGVFLRAICDDEMSQTQPGSFTNSERTQIKNDIYNVAQDIVLRSISVLSESHEDIQSLFDTALLTANSSADKSCWREVFASEVYRENDRNEWKKRFLQLVVGHLDGETVFHLRLAASKAKLQDEDFVVVECKRLIDCYPLLDIAKDAGFIKKKDVRPDTKRTDAFALQWDNGHTHAYIAQDREQRAIWELLILQAIRSSSRD